MKRLGLFALLLAIAGEQRWLSDMLTALLTGGAVVQGVSSPQEYPGAPGAGTANITTITINGSPDGGTFQVFYGGTHTPSQVYNVANATLQAALVLLPGIGTGGVVVTGTPGTNIILTWQHVGVRTAITVLNAMTNAGNPVAAPGVVNGTPGVGPTPAGVMAGGLVLDTSNKFAYINTGTITDPTWTKVGAQS
jgi:hypothetical protein